VQLHIFVEIDQMFSGLFYE